MTRSEFVLSQDGAPLNSTYINDIVHDYGELANVPTVTAHALRHSHALLLISLGENPLVIRDRLGHKDVRTTLEIYGHLYPKSDIEASKRLEGLVTVPSEWKSFRVCRVCARAKQKADKSTFVSLKLFHMKTKTA